MMVTKSIVLKFGGAAVSSVEQFDLISNVIIDRKKHYDWVTVVISAMGNTTDELISLAKKVNKNPNNREMDMLMSSGERISMSLLAMALQAKNVNSLSFTGSQSGIITTNEHSNAKIIDVKPYRLLEHLNNGIIAIVAGFQGMSENKEITTLGRGGSDTSAVALGVALNAEKVEFFKDTSGIYTKDPNKYKDATFMSNLNYDEALNIVYNSEHQVLQERSILLAQKNNLPLRILSFNEYFLYKDKEIGTLIQNSINVQNLNKYFEN